MKRLVLDVMLGKLARYLRMCGYDTIYALDIDIEDDKALAKYARETDRFLLTRDSELANRIDNVCLIENLAITGQLQELHTAGFVLTITEPTRCSRCNTIIDRVRPTESTPEYAPSPDAQSVWRCEPCDQYYWKGSHWEDVKARVAEVRSS